MGYTYLYSGLSSEQSVFCSGICPPNIPDRFLCCDYEEPIREKLYKIDIKISYDEGFWLNYLLF